MTLPETELTTKPSLAAAVLLWALDLLRSQDAWPRTCPDVLALTGSKKSQAYHVRAELQAAAATLGGTPGRPRSEAEPGAALEVLRRTRDFLMAHPGAVADHGRRRSYSDGFRRFVIGLVAPDRPGVGLTHAQLADAVGVPGPTLKEWLARPATSDAVTGSPNTEPLVQHPVIATIVEAWSRWEGTFTDFCTHLHEEHRIESGKTFIATVLFAHGLRPRTARRKPATPWSRETFRRLFPGVQWIGDGTTLVIRVDDTTYAFNVEAIIDPAADALVGVTVTDTEDEQAVIAAFDHGTQTTLGEPPLALTLDNRPSNHSPAVEGAVAPTLLLHSTPGRGQAKAPIEGAFGLFQQTAPPLVVHGHSGRERARSILALVMTLWAWTRNGKPRARFGGRSPAEVYTQAKPSPEELEQGRDWLSELRQREALARRTRAARADPDRRAVLERGLADLGIDDPEHKLAVAFAVYGLDAIQRGLATFRARRDRGTLPPDADPRRYLGGIFRNLDIRLDLERMAEHLLDLRLRHRDAMLAQLVAESDALHAHCPQRDLPEALVGCALATDKDVDFRFWSRAAAAALATANNAKDLYGHLARTAAASFATDRDRRADLIDRLAYAAASVAA